MAMHTYLMRRRRRWTSNIKCELKGAGRLFFFFFFLLIPDAASGVCSPVSVSSHIPRQPLGQVGADTVQFLRGWQGVERQLLHVGLHQSILEGRGWERETEDKIERELFQGLVDADSLASVKQLFQRAAHSDNPTVLECSTPWHQNSSVLHLRFDYFPLPWPT